MIVIKFDELTTPAEYQKLLGSNVDEFVAEAETLELEDLKDLETTIIDLLEENDERIRQTIYNLPESTDFDGTQYKTKAVADIIAKLLDNMEVDFKMSLGVFEAYKFWSTLESPAIPYPVFDATIRLLGTLRFKGHKQLRDVLTVNEFFTPCHEAYQKDTTYTYYLSSLHNVIMEKMEQLKSAE